MSTYAHICPSLLLFFQTFVVLFKCKNHLLQMSTALLLVITLRVVVISYDVSEQPVGAIFRGQ
jgi:hypothetical protein